jgi:hypothetical protein
LVRNARPKTPSKSASIFCSMFRSTVTGGFYPAGEFTERLPAGIALAVGATANHPPL